MNFEVDDLLDHVDEWKSKLHEKLKNLTPKQRPNSESNRGSAPVRSA